MADSSTNTIILRREALALGLPRYFTGKPCKHGHIAERGTSRGECRECHSIWCAENRDKLNSWKKRWRAMPTSAELERAQARRYSEKYPDRRAESAKRWRENNPERALEALSKSYFKRMENPKNRLDAAVRTGVNLSIRKGSKAGRKTIHLLGYSREKLVKHLEAQFKEGMTWDNYGEWHIDHIIPLSAFNFETPDDIDFKRAWALKNLQPLWAFENHRKRDKLDAPFQPSLI